eukprot:CAMPEP_0167759690 /NCGR_PEP_ID=MMETSP0110_2-20121227/11161_1 /TAXON_ID=629695 /ORGANISM="Gymnochlora sp., Strain CCMP2014" /LENGTH=633 /DNA_ID=CAMNT_0007646099 /DNA_START=8 /DNA_END=1909 /DNA_ORIENTATION=-
MAITEEQVRAIVEAELAKSNALTNAALDATWTMVGGVLVFMMQLGFGLLEAGSIQSINSQSILYKNLLDTAIVSIGWWAFGYALASDTGDGFSGDGTFTFSEPKEEWVGLFFNWTFASATATIVSGAVAGRMRLLSYITVSTLIGWVLFPIVSHWVWASSGWLYKRGFIDFAGSGVVHLVGGVCALCACIIVGPRTSRFEYMIAQDKWVDRKPRGHSVMMAFIGTMLLWLGWYGFNAGSTLGVSDDRFIVAVTCLFNTSLASSASVIGMSFIGFVLPGDFSLWDVLNSAIAGLVAVTAGCATMKAWGAILTGLFSSFVYKGCATLIAKLHIDDPVDAISVHGACGFLGLICTALFSHQELIDRAYGEGYIDNYDVGKQLGIQIYAALSMALFCSSFVIIVLLPWKYLIPMGIRISEKDELVGNDYGYFGGYAYPDWEEMVRMAKTHDKRQAEIQNRNEKKKWRRMSKVTSPNRHNQERSRSRIEEKGSKRERSLRGKTQRTTRASTDTMKSNSTMKASLKNLPPPSPASQMAGSTKISEVFRSSQQEGPQSHSRLLDTLDTQKKSDKKLDKTKSTSSINEIDRLPVPQSPNSSLNPSHAVTNESLSGRTPAANESKRDINLGLLRNPSGLSLA